MGENQVQQASSNLSKTYKTKKGFYYCCYIGAFIFMVVIFINSLRLFNLTRKTSAIFINDVVVDDSPQSGSRMIASQTFMNTSAAFPFESTATTTLTTTESNTTTPTTATTISTITSKIINNITVNHVIDCPSQFHVSSSADEQSPILFRHGNNNRQDLLVCRCPKVGSTMLRNILNSYNYHRNSNNNKKKNTSTNFVADYSKKPKSPKEDWLLGYSKMTQTEFQYWLTSNQVSRIMFVRHPVMRIASGYFEICYGNPYFRKYLKSRKALNGDVKAIHQRQIQQLYDNNITKQQQQQQSLRQEDYIKLFRRFIRHPNLLQKDYQSECGSSDESSQQQQQLHASETSRKTLEQHWSPPQHCRCGINDCSVKYKIYHIERIQSIQSILKQYLFDYSGDNNNVVVPGWFPSEAVVANSKKKNSTNNSKSSFYNQFIQGVLSDTVILSKLNNITKKEQEYFGYLPLALQHVQNGTIGLKSDF